MKKTFEFFVLNMYLSTSQVYDLEMLEILLERKVEPLCIKFIRICLENLYIVPMNSRFSSLRLCRPVFVQPPIHAWGFILKMLNQRQIKGGQKSSKCDEDYIKTMFSTDIINKLTLSGNHDYHNILMNLKFFDDYRFFWFYKYPEIYEKYMTKIVTDTISFDDVDISLAKRNATYT